jgi:hypothetical protein
MPGMSQGPSRQRVLVLLAAVALVAASGVARAEEGGGVRADRPLGVITPGPWRGLFLDLPLADARAGAEPRLTVRWWMANSWSIPTVLQRGGRAVEVQQDEQADVLEATVRVGWAELLGEGPLASRLSTAAAWRLTEHWGGWSDRLIEAWHRLGSFDGFDRSSHPRDAVRLTLREPGGATALALTGPRLAGGNLVLRTSARLIWGEAARGPWAVTARLDLKLPTGRLADAGGSGGLDLGLALGASGPLAGWLTGHAQGTVARLSPLSSALPLQPERWQVGVEASLAAALPAGWVALVESRALAPLFPGDWALGQVPPRQGDAVTAITRWQNQITLGIRKGAVTAWLSEDFTPGQRRPVGWSWFYDTNAPDLVLGVAVEQ